MTTRQYVALLRGINVGGRNKVAMADLRSAFEAHGYGAVRTYIQSGNVLFESSAPARTLETDIEGVLERRFGVPLVVVVRSHTQLGTVVDDAPTGFGASPDTYHSDTLFLKAPLTAKQAMKVVELREGVDQAWPGRGVLYFSRLERVADEESDGSDRGDAGVQADDDQKLDDDDEVAQPARRLSSRERASVTGTR